ncbi:hypothetical protein PG993_010839 [Apiospora rasikravindrae]|uniref:Uncharacterized protein n=1 Tax=Apiospora rasikravindrae TaxID=990691 RepID=A0ABR1SE28_9PEZI
MSAGRATHLEPPPQAPTTSSTTHTSPKPPPPPPQPPTHTPIIMRLPPRSTLPDLPQVGRDAAWVPVKIILRALCLLLGLLLAAFALWQRAHDAGDATALVLADVSLSVGLLAAAWNGAEFVTMGARRSARRGLAAEAHVALELLLWVSGVAGSITQAFVGYSMYANSGAATVAFYAVLGYGSFSLFLFPPSKVDLHLFVIYQGRGSLGAHRLTWFPSKNRVLEFGLFVRSCLEVDRRKKDRRIQQLVIALQMQQQQQQQLLLQQQPQHNNNIASPVAESATTWGPEAPPSTSDYDRELNIKYQGPMPEPLYDPRDLQKVLIIDPRLRGIVN